MKYLKDLLFLLFALLTSSCTQINRYPPNSNSTNSYPTFTEPSGFTDTCFGYNLNGNIVKVTGMNGFANGFAGYATHNQSGAPIIIFDTNKIFTMGIQNSIVLRFLYFHECAHHSVPTTNEVLTSCEGLKEMRRRNLVTPSQESEIRVFHNNIGYMGPNYGGTGTDHWNLTIECANY